MDSNTPLDFYLREVATIRPLTKGEEDELMQHIWAQDEKAESATARLIEGHLHLVVSVVQSHSSAGVPSLDLIERGNESLLYALKTFTKSSNQTLSDHVAACIERVVLKAIDESPHR